MGILANFIKKFSGQRKNKFYADMLNNRTPVYSMFGQDIFASDVVEQAVNCIVFELKKLSIVHINSKGFDPVPVNDSAVSQVLKEPNERMTQSDFIEKMIRCLFAKDNAFVLKTYDNKKNITGLWPINPSEVAFVQNDKGVLFVEFKFANGYETTIPYDNVIHIRNKFFKSDFMGGNSDSYLDSEQSQLLKTVQLNDKLLKGVSKALDSSYAINGVIKYNTMLDGEKMEENIKELEKRLRNNESGLLGLDLKGEFIPLQNKIELVDSATLKFIDEKILRHFGVSLPILTGDYTKEQYEAFYQKTLEPLIISLNQEFTKKIFTPREKQLGNEIKFYPHELIFMNTSQKIELFKMLVDTSSCYQNELRVGFGMIPLADLEGKLAVSSNKQNAENNTEEAMNENNDGGSDNG